MPTKLSFEHVYNYIKEKGYELLSTEYKTNKDLLDIKCKDCDKIYKQIFDRFKRGFYHPNCKTIVSSNSKTILFGGYKKPVTLQPIICLICQKEFQPSHSVTKLCSIACSQAQWRTPEYRQNAIKNGQKAGKISAQKQSRRSQNKIYFSELCLEYFTITTNETFFDGWDADVIIHSDKMAVLWNGIWHYKQISKTQSLKQVQARDKVKTAIIEKKGYAPFVIVDMGKHDKNFVDQEFATFLLMRMATKILE
jgi:uncharacterized CHY-type Zn-finger protein